MHWQYVIPGYLVVFLGLAVYSAHVLRRSRTLSTRVEPGKRRFLP